MPNETNNLKLKKPLVGEAYDVNIHNQNMDIIDTNISLLDVKQFFAGRGGFGIANVFAYQIGKIVWLRFDCKPIAGWNNNIIYLTTTGMRPRKEVPVTVHKTSGADLAKSITGAMAFDGQVTLNSSAVFEGVCYVSVVYMID